MTYDVFGGTLSLTQSINQSILLACNNFSWEACSRATFTFTEDCAKMDYCWWSWLCFWWQLQKLYWLLT